MSFLGQNVLNIFIDVFIIELLVIAVDFDSSPVIRLPVIF